MNEKELRALAIDLYKGNIKSFTKEDGTKIDPNDALRQLLLEKCGGEFSVRNFRRIENDFYEILEVLITVGTSEITRDMFSQIMEFKDTAYGEKPEFIVENPDLFEVSIIANGTDNLIRQRIFNQRVQTTAFDLGLSIYSDLDAFLLGRIDWKKMIDKVILSFNKKVCDLIGMLFAKAYNSVSAADLKKTGSMNKDDLVELVEKVGNGAMVFGTKLALSKIPEIEGFAVDSGDLRNLGYVRMFNGISCVELENHYDKETQKFVLPNDTLFIIPDGMKILFGGFEGDARIIDNNPSSRLDRQIEFRYMRRVHLGLAVANRYGVYVIK